MINARKQKRRGLSTVIGAVFMILVTIGALNAVLWTMQQQNSVTESIIEKSNANLDKLNEDIDITNVRVDGNKLNMTITNTGGAAATLKSIYVVNETANQQYRYDLDLVVDGRESKKGVGQDIPLVIKDDIKYSVRLITESGNTASTTLTPLSSVALPMSLYIIPPTVSPGNNVTVLFTVSHNITDSDLASEVTPWIDANCNGCTLTEKISPSGPAMLNRGNTALFKWVYTVSTPDQLEHTLIFNASIENAKHGNYIRETGLAKLVDGAQISYQSEIIISNDLVQKPEIFLILPGPAGDVSGDNEKALWGVVVVNPTNQTMTISRLVINTYTSLATAGQSMVEDGPSSCGASQLTQKYPSSGWTCPHDNMIEWKNAASPVSIEGYGIETFFLMYKPGSLTEDEPSFMISVGVFSSLGQFTKTGLSSSMRDAELSIANVYLADTNDPNLADDSGHMFGHVEGFPDNTTVKLNVTVADLDIDPNTHIDSGAKLIVNVPRGFSEVDVVEAETTGFIQGAQEPRVIGYADGTIQIIATIDGDLGDQNSREAKVLSFTAKTPVVSGTKVYIMHSLLDGEADGSTTTDWPVGSIAQIALQVCEDLDEFCE